MLTGNCSETMKMIRRAEVTKMSGPQLQFKNDSPKSQAIHSKPRRMKTMMSSMQRNAKGSSIKAKRSQARWPQSSSDYWRKKSRSFFLPSRKRTRTRQRWRTLLIPRCIGKRAPCSAIHSKGTTASLLRNKRTTPERKVTFLPTRSHLREQRRATTTPIPRNNRTIFNKEPGMSVRRRISVTHRPNTEDRYDRIVLAFASLAMYLTLRQKNQDLFKEEDVSFELTARWDDTSLIKWTRKWMHNSLKNDKLWNEETVTTMMLAHVIKSDGTRIGIKASTKKKGAKEEATLNETKLRVAYVQSSQNWKYSPHSCGGRHVTFVVHVLIDFLGCD